MEPALKIHLIGIAGSAMGNLAAMLKSRGHDVSGSDAGIYPPMSEQLAAWEIPCKEGFDPGRLAGKDLVIIGNAISRGNPEVEAVLNRELAWMSLPEALRHFFLKGKKTIVVAGSHGKSTTTAFIAWMLQVAGRKPSWFFGGVGQEGQRSWQLGDGDYFVIEGDEYDSAFFDKGSKFFHYRPRHLILTSLEFDHGDIFRDIAELEKAFSILANTVPGKGVLIACRDYPHLKAALKRLPLQTPILWYRALSRRKLERRLAASRAESGQNRELFSRRRRGKTTWLVGSRVEQERQFYYLPGLGRLESRLMGRHNGLNILAGVMLGRELGLDDQALRQAVETFPGVRRRQNVLLRSPFVLVDDFAHHPTAVAETIRAVSEIFPDRPLWALFEPRSATAHLRVFEGDWPRAFRKADRVYLSNVFNPEKFDRGRMINMEKVAARMKNARYFADNQSLGNQLLADIAAGIDAGPADRTPVVLLMSNGNFGGLRERVLKAYPPS